MPVVRFKTKSNENYNLQICKLSLRLLVQLFNPSGSGISSSSPEKKQKFCVIIYN